MKKVGINWDDFAEIHAGDQINLLQLTVQQVKDDQLGGKIEYEQNMGYQKKNFKYIYDNHNQYNKVIGKNYGFEIAE